MKWARAALGLALSAAVFAVAFAVGHALAESDHGEIGEPQLLSDQTANPRIVALTRAASLPPLEKGADPDGDGGGGGGGGGGDGDGDGGDGGSGGGEGEAPIAHFFAPDSAVVDELIELDARKSRDPDGGALRYEWKLHGSKFELGEEVQFTSYPTAGPVDVTLRVTDQDNLSTERTRMVMIEDKPASAGEE